MNQSTSNTNPALEGAANGEAPTKATGQRRYRRPARAKSTAAQPATATPLEVSTSVSVPSTGTKSPATAKNHQNGEDQEQGQRARLGWRRSARHRLWPGDGRARHAAGIHPTPQPRSRTRRNNGRRNKGDVHLVASPAPSGSALETTPAAEAVAIPAEAYSLPAPVPVLTRPAQFDGAIPPSPAPEQEAATTRPEPAPRRYRFDRRVVTSAPTGETPRPERLSGLRSIEPGTETPAAAEAATAPEAIESTETPPETPETPVAADEPFNFFAPHPTGTYTRGATGDDILSELGLGKAQRETDSEDVEPVVGSDHDGDHFTGTTLASVPEASDTDDETGSTVASGAGEAEGGRALADGAAAAAAHRM